MVKKTALVTALPAMASIEVILDVVLQIINIFEALIELLENLGLRFGGSDE